MNITNISQANGKDSASISGFTKDQLNAYKNLIEFINKPYDEKDFKRALVGAAGTGKTYLLKSIIKNCNLSYSVIGLSAPTHKACRVLNESIGIPNIKINTLQSDLGLKLNFDVEKFDIDNPPFDPKGRIKIKDLQLYIVDESSMIPNNNRPGVAANKKCKGLLYFLENICKTNKCKLIYVGDASQLPPVNEKYSSAFRNIQTCKLTEVVRQGDDNPISYLLKLLRWDIKNKSFKFLEYISKHPYKFDDNNIKGYATLNPKDFEQVVITNFSDEQLTNNTDFAKVIAYTNNTVSGWNKFIRNVIIEDADKSALTKNDLLISYVTIVDQFNSAIIKNSEEYIIKDIVNYTHPTYGIKGFMVVFTAIHGGYNTSPLFVINHKDRFSIAKYIQTSKELIESAKSASANLRASRWKEYYKFKESCLLLTNIVKPDGTIMFGRNLDYGFSLTAHKSQGSTFDTTLVDVNDIVFDKYGKPYTDAEEINRRLYVACSRAKNRLYLKYGR